MKKLYIPTEEDLHIIQTLSGNDTLYKYILTKVIEKMLNEGMIIKNCDKDLISIPEVVAAICYIYPQEIGYSDLAKQNLNLFLRIINKKEDNSLQYVDYISQAIQIIQYNDIIVNKIIELLNQGLQNNPRYRLYYHESEILDSIFEIDYQKFEHCNDMTKDRLMNIDPIYLIKFLGTIKMDRNIERENGNKLSRKVDTYSYRYGIDETVGLEYRTRDILKRPDEKVRRLVRFMNKQ